MKKKWQQVRKWIRLVRTDAERTPGIGRVIRKSKAMSLPGFQQVPLYDVMRFYVESLGKGIIFQRAAALTYRVFIALVPMIIALFSVISFLGEGVQNVLLEMIESVVPTYAWTAVSKIVTDVVTRQNGTFSITMLVVGIYFTILCMNGILVALNTSYYDEVRRNFIKQIGYSVVLMAVFFTAIVVVVMLFIVSSVLINDIHERLLGGTSSTGYIYIIHLVKWLLIYSTIYMLVSFTYYIAPVDRRNYRFFSAGSITCTVLLVILLWALNIYFSNFSNYNLIYGSLGALFAILLWLNWSSLVLIIGYDLNVSIAKAKSLKGT